ncbi:hypothetical protein HCN44_003433 [Aphidius gifuensis]|uniref:Uncharacterized protein n=1 Tax=Aphidius gifuensis TaxID=684658 RepID=A0A834XIV2_APHGI|nr:uncharacterized protein LOC122859491 [Aphidius gifuensis]KAF7987570.1 hypothetical protein HCN44_003433 [Aphidius gifuensis]
MYLFHVFGVIFLVASVSASGTDFLSKSLNECIATNSWTSCLKHEVLSYLDDKLGTTTEIRSVHTIDEAILTRTMKFLKQYNYNIDIPFFEASLKYRPSRSLTDLDIEFEKNDIVNSEARGILKKKLLLPVLLLLKLKMKALMPIFVAIIGLKAMKALILSKLALLVVVGFIALQFFKKSGMTPPMGMAMEIASPTTAYGAPPQPTTTSSYEPVNTWDGNGPYSRVWTPANGADVQNLAYSYYSPSSTSGTSSPNTYSVPVSSSSSLSSSNGSSK